MDLQMFSLEGKSVASIVLPHDIFGLEPRVDLLHRMVRYQLAKRHVGTHQVQGRSDVSCSTAKIHKQKGSGRARHGARGAPLFRGGGKAHGPVVRSHEISLPKKVRALALKHALSSKVKSGVLTLIDFAVVESGKTSVLRKQFKNLGWSSVLIVDGVTLHDGFVRAVRNIPNADILPIQGINVYDILRCDRLVLTKAAAEALEARFK